MTSLFVVDASIAMSWCFEDETAELGERALESLETGEAIAPEIWPLEVANALLVAERRGRIKRIESARFVRELRALPIRVEAPPFSGRLPDLLELGRATGLSSYDASYLHLAGATELPLATLDNKLRDSAQSLGIPLF